MPDDLPGFDCELHRSGDAARVAAAGELDIATVEAVVERIEEGLADGARRLVLDLSGLTFMASTGLRLVLQLVERADSGEIDLGVVPGPPQVQRVFQLTGTETRVPWTDG